MRAPSVRVVDVYPYRQVDREPVRFLLLRRAGGALYGGQWRMVGGKIEPGETAWQAAQRELREETGCTPLRFWAVPSVNASYEWQTDTLNLTPAFAARLDADPHLDDEHDAFGWFYAEQAARHLAWPEQRRLLRLVNALLQAGGPSPGWIVPVS